MLGYYQFGTLLTIITDGEVNLIPVEGCLDGWKLQNGLLVLIGT